MSAFLLPASCPLCGGAVELVNARATGFVSLAILECDPCEWQFEVLARIEKHARTQRYAQRVQDAKNEGKRRARNPELVVAG